VTSTPTWYDVLGVDRDASPDEIREAWRAGTSTLEPGDRRFDTLNKAARVLLDPEQRASYDAGLGDPVDEADEHDEHDEHDEAGGTDEADELPGTDGTGSTVDPPGPRPRAAAGGIPTWMLAALAALAVVMVAATAWAWTQQGESEEEAVREAQAAAEQAVVPVLSYDHRSLESDAEAARGYLTEDYREEYDRLVAVLEENAPSTRTTVTAEVVSSGIVRSGEDRVDVLLFVDRPTTNKLNRTPIVYRDQVTLTMQRSGDRWLVDEMVTSPAQQ